MRKSFSTDFMSNKKISFIDTELHPSSHFISARFIASFSFLSQVIPTNITANQPSLKTAFLGQLDPITMFR